MAGEIQRLDFVQSLYYQDLDVSPELYDYVRSYRLEKIDHAETSFYREPDEQLWRLTLACVDSFFISIGKQLKKSGMEVLKMWVQKYATGAYHPVHVHATTGTATVSSSMWIAPTSPRPPCSTISAIPMWIMKPGRSGRKRGGASCFPARCRTKPCPMRMTGA